MARISTTSREGLPLKGYIPLASDELHEFDTKQAVPFYMQENHTHNHQIFCLALWSPLILLPVVSFLSLAT